MIDPDQCVYRHEVALVLSVAAFVAWIVLRFFMIVSVGGIGCTTGSKAIAVPHK
jgi:hypothetical protein